MTQTIKDIYAARQKELKKELTNLALSNSDNLIKELRAQAASSSYLTQFIVRIYGLEVFINDDLFPMEWGENEENAFYLEEVLHDDLCAELIREGFTQIPPAFSISGQVNPKGDDTIPDMAFVLVIEED